MPTRLFYWLLPTASTAVSSCWCGLLGAGCGGLVDHTGRAAQTRATAFACFHFLLLKSLKSVRVRWKWAGTIGGSSVSSLLISAVPVRSALSMPWTPAWPVQKIQQWEEVGLHWCDVVEPMNIKQFFFLFFFLTCMLNESVTLWLFASAVAVLQEITIQRAQWWLEFTYTLDMLDIISSTAAGCLILLSRLFWYCRPIRTFRLASQTIIWSE